MTDPWESNNSAVVPEQAYESQNIWVGSLVSSMAVVLYAACVRVGSRFLGADSIFLMTA